MAKKPTRNRNQTISLRTSAAARYTLERSSIFFRQSMTDVIERSVSLMTQAEEFPLPQCIKPSGRGDKISLREIISLTWSDDEVIRLLRLGLLAPALLSSDEACAVIQLFGITPYTDEKGRPVSFYGKEDVFQGIEMSDEYYESWPRFDLKLCHEHIERLKERAQGNTVDIGLVFRGELGDLRQLKAIPII